MSRVELGRVGVEVQESSSRPQPVDFHAIVVVAAVVCVGVGVGECYLALLRLVLFSFIRLLSVAVLLAHLGALFLKNAR